ncbi:MAG: glycosyltransferase involved in cell wall biosynthesis [Methylophagaceae bacterium]|jgi:glycosyltransferase involved in cell wall biosynthesis
MTDKHTVPLKIAHVLAGAPRGGAENFYTRLVCELAAEKELKQYAFTRTHELREQAFSAVNIEMQAFKFGSLVHFIDHYQYRKALKKVQPDIVLTYMNRATSLTPKGDYKLVARLGHYYDLKYYKHCDYWIGITKGICDYLINSGLPVNRVVHIPNFVNETKSEPVSRDSFSTPAGVPILFALGRLHIHKGFDILLRALAEIDTEAVLWLAGDGPEKDNLQQLANELGIAEQIRFLGWQTNVNALMQTADLFICPSRHEGLGSIIIEAWFNRCPMVATASQGPSELITDQKNGLVTPIDDVSALAAAINTLLENPQQAKELAKQGYLEYQQKYSRDGIIEQYKNFFKQITE